MLADIVHASEVMYGKKNYEKNHCAVSFLEQDKMLVKKKNKHTHYTPQIYLFQQTNKTRC